MADMKEVVDHLTASIAQLTTIDDSMFTLVKGISDQLRQNANDAAAVSALADQLDSEVSRIASAVTENTPASPEPPPVVTPPADTPPPADTSAGADTTSGTGSDTVDAGTGSDAVSTGEPTA